MKRFRISGFVIGKLSNYHVEVVTNNYLPVQLAIWKGSKFVWRLRK